ncbi:hypothetical protein [Aquimarina rhabdastrellae]
MNSSSYYEEDTKALGNYILEIIQALEIDFYQFIYKALQKEKDALILYRQINEFYETGVACSQAITVLKITRSYHINQNNNQL